jgi:TonB family protein
VDHRLALSGLLGCLLVTPALGAADKKNPGKTIDKLQETCFDRGADSCAQLADLYIFGDGVALRPEKAREFLSRFCALDRQPHDPCLDGAVGLTCRRLAEIYERGEGTGKDELLAAGYYRIGSKRGDAVSSAALARMLEAGASLPKDAVRARAQLQKACGQKGFLTRECGLTEPRVAEYDKAVAAACDGLAPEERASAAAPGRDDGDEIAKHVGQIREPRKVHDQLPTYPHPPGGVQGDVVLAAYVDVDGHVKRMTVVSSPNEMLTKAAIAAVRQWVYTPTLLDGIPVPVTMTVTVTFRLS